MDIDTVSMHTFKITRRCPASMMRLRLVLGKRKVGIFMCVLANIFLASDYMCEIAMAIVC